MSKNFQNNHKTVFLPLPVNIISSKASFRMGIQGV